MRFNLKKFILRLLELIRLRPFSLAEKCRVAFGGAVLLVLALALLLPYIWMGRLATQASLDASRAKAEILIRNHFQLRNSGETALATLNNTGTVMDANASDIRWIRFTKESQKQSV